MYNLPPEHVPHYFTGTKKLYRILASGDYAELTYLTGGKLAVTLDGERLFGPDIAWCLHYGNWPKFPLAQLDNDPFNCAIDNLFPARHKRLRYRETLKGSRYFHPLSTTGFLTSHACRLDWQVHARSYYAQDLGYVLELEAREREMRSSAGVPAMPPPERRVAASKPRVAYASTRPLKPGVIKDMEWHWYQGAWVSVPVACHVADDYVERLRKWALGARRFEFQAAYQEVWGFDAAGAVVR